MTGIIDVGFIAVQAARGTFSHFNANPDTFNQVGQQVFMSGVLGLFGASVVIAIMLLFQRVGDAPLNRAIRIGLAAWLRPAWSSPSTWSGRTAPGRR